MVEILEQIIKIIRNKPAQERKQILLTCSKLALDGMKDSGDLRISFSTPTATGSLRCVNHSSKGGSYFNRMSPSSETIRELLKLNGEPVDVRFVDDENGHHSIVVELEELAISRK